MAWGVFLVMRGPIILIAWFYLFPMTAIVMRNIVMRIFRFTWQKRPVRGRSSNRLRPEGQVYISAATVVAGNRESAVRSACCLTAAGDARPAWPGTQPWPGS